MVLLILIILCIPYYNLNAQEDLSYLKPIYEKNKIMHAIALIESNDGQNVNHQILANDSFAIGKYALMPATIKYIIKNNIALKQYKHLLKFTSNQLKQLLNNNAYLNDKLAYCYYDMVVADIGTNNPAYVGYAWLNGPYKTKQVIKSKKNIACHWHVKKMLIAYNRS